MGSELAVEDEEDLDIQTQMIFLTSSAQRCILRNR